MENIPGTLVASTTRSLVNQDGSSHQLSDQGAALLSSMRIEGLSYENSQVMLTLLSLLLGITENTTSGDVIALSMYRAKDLSEQLGVSEEIARDTLQKFDAISRRLRSWNPLAF